MLNGYLAPEAVNQLPAVQLLEQSQAGSFLLVDFGH
jgi:hypothetical protein